MTGMRTPLEALVPEATVNPELPTKREEAGPRGPGNPPRTPPSAVRWLVWVMGGCWMACTAGCDLLGKPTPAVRATAANEQTLPGMSSKPLSEWSPECFATEITGTDTARGWSMRHGKFDPETPDLSVSIDSQGRLESVGSLDCELTLDGWAGTYDPAILDTEENPFHRTCAAHYICGGYPFSMEMFGVPLTTEWDGALWALSAYEDEEVYEGVPFDLGSSWQTPPYNDSPGWNIGRADLAYDPCVPFCAPEAECGADGCEGYCGQCQSPTICDWDTQRCDGGIGQCVQTGGTCSASDFCCLGLTCVSRSSGGSTCRSSCASNSDCASGCCAPLVNGGSVCSDPEFCAPIDCVETGDECSPSSCCPGSVCLYIDFVGPRCQAQSAECPAGCESLSGASCCRPPNCGGQCSSSPCCID